MIDDARRFTGQSWFAALTLLTASLASGADPLKSATDVLGAIDGSEQASTERPVSPAHRLVDDIIEYRRQSSSLPPDLAASRWFELRDRATRLGPVRPDDLRAYDGSTNSPVGELSLLASLPPPPAWKLLRAEAARRASGPAPEIPVLALRYLTETLTGDRAAATATLAAIDKRLKQVEPGERHSTEIALRRARVLQAQIYGSVDDRLSVLADSLLQGESYESTEIPDVVAMVGEERAASMLKDLVMTSTSLSVAGGDATRNLVRRLALAGIDRMRVPQWSLVDGIDAAPLFVAISKRFPVSDDATPEAQMYEWRWRTAALYYFLAMVKDRNQTEAERTLASLAGKNDVVIPRDAVDALQRARLNEPLFEFLRAQLGQHPELRAWGLFIEQAAQVGRSDDALKLIDSLLARKSLPDFVVADLRARRVAALLAADRIDPAAAGFEELLSKPPSRGEPGLATREAAALKAAAVGRLLDRKDLSALGLKFARQAAALREKDESRPAFESSRAFISELRRQGFAAEAQSITVEQLKSSRQPVEAYEGLPGSSDNQDLYALVELAGIYAAAGRHRDVVELLTGSSRWGVPDIGRLVAMTDSLNVPLGAMAAQALEATGDKAAALRIARALVLAMPGRDVGYEVVARLDPDAASTFDGLYRIDQFEERPLIWKARVLLDGGNLRDAEAVIRRAIAIDPSDGEEGPNDRMRAYAVLAEILKRNGDAENAETFAKAVAAIRLSETADAQHAAGLYVRAFDTYRNALTLFSDAYCIQSRLAVQLNKQGRRREALEHYRRAYELMPDSFGRVESHCFGCESVFQDAEAQTIAEKVFGDVIRSSPGKAQAHYLLAYLRETRGDYEGAVQPLRAAVGIDGSYLNAWKRLHDIGEKTYLEPGERDIARLMLLELDPLQRHSRYDLAEVGQLEALWRGAAAANEIARRASVPDTGVYALDATARAREKNLASFPEEMREQIAIMERLMESAADAAALRREPAQLLREHALIQNAAALMGLAGGMPDY